MDVVYFVKEGTLDNIELKYSLRSLKNIKHDRVFIVGYKPEWIDNIVHIPFYDREGNKFKNVMGKYKYIFDNELISEDFIFFNDDFFLLEGQEIEYHTMCSLKIQVDYLKNRLKSRYIKIIEGLYKLFPDGQSFETHSPIIYNKEKGKKIYSKYGYIHGFRTIYCNEYGVEGTELCSESYTIDDRIKDCKYYGLQPFKIKEGQKLLSCNDESVKGILPFLNEKFPDKSIYEK